MKITIGSTSKRKIEVVKKVFSQYFSEEKLELTGHSAPSGVPDTPYDKQTYDGAMNRALDCKSIHKADYYIGLESGLVERYGRLYEEAWACVITKGNLKYFGYSSGLALPEYIMRRMKELKMEHNDAMTVIEQELNTGVADTWGTYTGGIILREVSLEEAIRNALIQTLPRQGNLYRLSSKDQ